LSDADTGHFVKPNAATWTCAMEARDRQLEVKYASERREDIGRENTLD
jgi:hypothetical protein